jgi:hypothetical protein
MARKKAATFNSKTKTIGLSIRIDMAQNRRLSAILALKGMTATAFFQRVIDKFIKENYKEAREMLNLDDLAEDNPQLKNDETTETAP